MTKRIIGLLLALLLLACMPALAEEPKWSYDNDNMYLKLDGDLSGDVTIPSEVDGYLVNAIEDNAFYEQHEITSLTMPDSLRALRRAAMPHDWAVHVPPEAVSGMYGTVSAHAATIVAVAVLSCGAIRRKWFTALMVVCTLVICYSRIYLGKHFPMDIVWGTLVGLGLGYAALRGYRRLAQSRNRRFTHPR